MGTLSSLSKSILAPVANETDDTQGAALVGWDAASIADFFTNHVRKHVPTFSELAAVDVTKYIQCFTKGYWFAGDGGHAAWIYINTTPQSSANGSTIIASTTGIGCWVMLFGEALKALQSGASGSGKTVTLTGTAGSTNVTLATTGDFYAAQSIGIYHGGAPCTVTAPAAGAVTNVGVQGSTTNTYHVVSLDGLGGCSAPSVLITSTTSNALQDGTNYDSITWTAVAGVVEYAIYSATGFIGLSTSNIFLNLQSGNPNPWVRPEYVPALLSATSLSQTLFTSIKSINNTRTAVLNAPLLSNVVDAIMRHDDSSAIQNALNSMTSGRFVMDAGRDFWFNMIQIVDKTNFVFEASGATCHGYGGTTDGNQVGVRGSGTLTNVHIHGLKFIGDATASSKHAGWWTPSGSVITNLEIDSFWIQDCVNGISSNTNTSGSQFNVHIHDGYVKNIIGVNSGQGYGMHVADGSETMAGYYIHNVTVDGAQRHSLYLAHGRGFKVEGLILKNHRANVFTQNIRPAVNVVRVEQVEINNVRGENIFDCFFNIARAGVMCDEIYLDGCKVYTVGNNVPPYIIGNQDPTALDPDAQVAVGSPNRVRIRDCHAEFDSRNIEAFRLYNVQDLVLEDCTWNITNSPQNDTGIDLEATGEVAGASFTGSITGTTLTVTEVFSGVIAVSQAIVGLDVVTGTTITGFLTGTGDTGTYTVSTAQNIASQPISCMGSAIYSKNWSLRNNSGSVTTTLPGGSTRLMRAEVTFLRSSVACQFVNNTGTFNDVPIFFTTNAANPNLSFYQQSLQGLFFAPGFSALNNTADVILASRFGAGTSAPSAQFTGHVKADGGRPTLVRLENYSAVSISGVSIDMSGINVSGFVGARISGYQPDGTYRHRMSFYLNGDIADQNLFEMFRLVPGAGAAFSAGSLSSSPVSTLESQGSIGTGWTTITAAGTTTLTNAYELVLIDATLGNVIINLPAVVNAATVNAGRKYVLKRVDASANTVTVQAMRVLKRWTALQHRAL